MSEVAPAAAPSAPAATSTPSAPATSSAPSNPSTSTAAPSAQRLTSAQMRDRFNGLGSFERDVIGHDEPESSEPADEIELPGDEPVETPDEVDAPEISDDPFAAYRDTDIHGMKALDILKALQEGKLPEALFDKLTLDLKDGDETWQDTVAAARNGAQMQRKFTQKSQALAEERRAFQSEQAGFNAEREDLVGFLRSWKEDPAKLRAGLLKLGMPFQQAAIIEAEQYGQIAEMRKQEEAGAVPKGTTDRLLRAQEMEAELEAARLQQERYAAREQAALAQQQEQQQRSTSENTAKEITADAVKMFERLGLKRDDGAWNYFKQYLGSVWTPGQARPSPAELEASVRATKQWADAQRAQVIANKPATTAPKLGARPLDGGAPSKPAPGASKKRLTAEQARAKYLK